MNSNTHANKDICQVRNFWENNPLWVGESEFPAGSKEFYQEHERITIKDCFAGEINPDIFPDQLHRNKVLELGCGNGFWVVQLSRLGVKELTAVDLTENAIELAKSRSEFYGFNANFKVGNAESLDLPNSSFDHVNCLGVIHHTPNTEACVKEIARVLKNNGTATISVYHKNFLLRYWSSFRWLGKILHRMGAGLKGRGRENIFNLKSADEIVRFYDGAENPIGKAYTKQEFVAMLAPYFEVEKHFYHFFPARSLPFPIPKFLHKRLDKYFGFMLAVRLRKKAAA